MSGQFHAPAALSSGRDLELIIIIKKIKEEGNIKQSR
jgi:hypothetical protein